MKEAFVVVFVEKVNLFGQKHSVKDLSLKVDIVRISHSDKVNWTLKNTLPWEKNISNYERYVEGYQYNK